MLAANSYLSTDAIRECELPLSPVDNSSAFVPMDVTEKSNETSSSTKNRAGARFSKDEVKLNESRDANIPLRSEASVVTKPTTAVHTVIFDCSSWLYIDTMGLEAVQLVSSSVARIHGRPFVIALPFCLDSWPNVGLVASGPPPQIFRKV